MRKLSVTLEEGLVFPRVLWFIYRLQVASYDLASIWYNKKQYTNRLILAVEDCIWSVISRCGWLDF